MNTSLTIASAPMLASLAVPALAQSNIDPAHKFSWQETCGWMNWRDASAGVQGVVAGPTHLSGWVWSENLGWVSRP